MRRQVVDGLAQSTRWRLALAALLNFAALALSTESRADPVPSSPNCNAADARWVAIETPEPAPAGLVDWRDVVRHVASELRVRDVALCNDQKLTRPLARLRLRATTDTSVAITLSNGAGDEVLGERSLELEPVPTDARPLAIAVATDELLPADWSEVERREKRAAPPEIPKKPVQAPPPTPAVVEPNIEVGPSFAFEAFSGGQRLLGVDARGAWRFAAPFALTARIGLRQGLPRSSEHGSLHASALLGGVGASVSLAESSRLRLDLFGRADALRLHASAYAEAGATEHADVGLAIITTGGVGLQLRLSRSIRLELEAAAGGVPRPVHITDTGQRVSGVSAVALELSGGVSAAF